MQALDDNFYYSPSRLINGNLEKEKHLLVEEQKMCRARARKFFQETLRRRKALEERRKLWDAQEQRIRENVLQQRRQKVQEATERFQRAHLSPSQRRRQPCKKNVPTLEDALSHIQGGLSSDNRQASFASISRLSRSHTPSPKSSSKPKPSPRRALSAVEAYTKLLQESSTTSLRSNVEVQKPKQEKQRDSSPQEDSFSDCIPSSVSSKDSLESEEPKHGTKYLNSLSSAFLHEADKNLSDLKKSLQQTMSTDTQCRKPHELKLKKQSDHETLRNKNTISNCSWGIVNNEKTPLTLSTEHYSIKSSKNSTNDNLLVPNGVPHLTRTEPDTPPPKPEPARDLRQPKSGDDRQLKHPSATEILLPTKNGSSSSSSTDYLYGASKSKPNVLLNNCTMDNACREGVFEQVSSRKDLSTPINNLNKISQDDKAEKKRLNTEFIHNACPDRDFEEQEPSETFQRIHKVTFIKGILKKQSRYTSGASSCGPNSGRWILTKQVALAIRDSVELTRAKSKDLESNSAVKKKLRWLDEVHLDKAKQIHSRSSKNSSEDHQVCTGGISGATQAVPNGYHFTRHAWADVGVQVSLPQQQHGDEVRAQGQQRNNRTSGPRVGTKERVEAAPVSSRTRKGTNMRPQSATEVSQIARSHGRLVMPRPPPPRAEVPEEHGLVHSRPAENHGPVHSRPAEGHGLVHSRLAENHGLVHSRLAEGHGSVHSRPAEGHGPVHSRLAEYHGPVHSRPAENHEPVHPRPAENHGPGSSRPAENHGHVHSRIAEGHGPVHSRPAEGHGTVHSRLAEGHGPVHSRPAEGHGPVHSRLAEGHGPVHSRPAEGHGQVHSRPAENHGSVHSRPAEEHVSHRDGVEMFCPVSVNHEVRADNGLLFMPRPPSYACTSSESKAKTKPRPSHADHQACEKRAGMGPSENGACLRGTPTEEEISQLWIGVRTALAAKDAQAALRRQVVESVQNGRKNSSGMTKLPLTQPPKQTPDHGRMFSVPPVFPDEDLLRFDHVTKGEMLQQQNQGATTISMEEERILQSLDRLNHRLHYVQEQSTGISSFIGFRNAPTADFNTTNPQKLQTPVYHPRYYRKV